MKTTFITWCVAMVIGLPTLSVAEEPRAKAGHAAEIPLPKEAVAVLNATQDNEAHGTVVFKQHEDFVHLTGEVRGLTPGKHGFHIHEFGDLRAADGSSAGGHYNPRGHQHGGPDAAEHHAGDLGNIVANERGVARVDIKSKAFQLHFVIGRALVVHGKADDLSSQPAGDAGPRVAIGVIGFASMEESTRLGQELKKGKQAR